MSHTDTTTDNVTREAIKRLREANDDMRRYHDPEYDGKYDASHEWRIPKGLKVVRLHSNDGESATTTLEISSLYGVPEKLVKRIASLYMNLDGTYCQHDYDCCANWYGGAASFDMAGDTWLVRKDLYMNI